ncbi:MAG TPA: aldo/keto reductase, partial [Candidatus Dormibacteraeota bacterium]|nr:aldo/keto reductase [Candidatus Dormibacteraeota bacterium]
SNFLAYRLARALGRSEALGLARFVSAQPRYNLLFREPERELMPLCMEEGIGVISYNPLAGGLLAGKHDFSKPPGEGTRFKLGDAGQMYQDRYWHQREFDTVSDFTRLAAEAGMKPATLAVAWVLHQPAITAPIIGASRPAQLSDSLSATEVSIEPILMEKLDTLTREYRRGDSER